MNPYGVNAPTSVNPDLIRSWMNIQEATRNEYAIHPLSFNNGNQCIRCDQLRVPQRALCRQHYIESQADRYRMKAGK